jgi:hypothetical protein
MNAEGQQQWRMFHSSAEDFSREVLSFLAEKTPLSPIRSRGYQEQENMMMTQTRNALAINLNGSKRASAQDVPTKKQFARQETAIGHVGLRR